MKEIAESFLRVFKKFPEELVDEEVNSVSITRGIIFHPNFEYYQDLMGAIENVFPESQAFNKTFHKSWNKIATADEEDLYVEQVLHYLSTYGMEFLQIDTDGYVYLPHEISEVPELRKYFVIETISQDEAMKFVYNTLHSGLALSQRTIDDLLAIVHFYNEKLDLRGIKNKDTLTKVFVGEQLVPETGEECMKVINYVVTGELTMVKNEDNLAFYKYVCAPEKIHYIEKILEMRLADMASVFYRYKKQIICLKHISPKCKKLVNKIRRMSDYNWVPAPHQSYLTTEILAQKIKPESVDLHYLTIYNLVKIYNRINHELWKQSGVDVFRIRNGKLYLKVGEEIGERTTSYQDWIANWLLAIVDEIQQRLKSENFRIKIPKGIELAFPESEKAFVGDVPIYSVLSPKGASVLGISWKNKGETRVDLDLSVITKTKKYGWNSSWRTEDNDILYSGDMTTEGAESFYLNNPKEGMLLKVNNFNGVGDVDADVFFANSDVDIWKNEGAHYTVDRNDIIYSSKLSLNNRQMIVGCYTDEGDFIFVGLSDGSGNVSRPGQISSSLIDYFLEKGESSLKLTDIFQVYDENEEFEEEPTIIDLENYSKSTIISLCTEEDDERQDI